MKIPMPPTRIYLYRLRCGAIAQYKQGVHSRSISMVVTHGCGLEHKSLDGFSHYGICGPEPGDWAYSDVGKFLGEERDILFPLHIVSEIEP